MAEAWLTYPQIAELWKMSTEAARARIRRGNYQRRVGNTGEAEAYVDTTAPVRKPRKPRARGQTGTSAQIAHPVTETPPAATVAALEALQGHIADLKAQIAKTDALADQYRQERDVERERVATLTAELLRRTGEMLDAKAKAEADAAARPRSWWSRLVG